MQPAEIDQALRERCTECGSRYLEYVEVAGVEIRWFPCCTYGGECVQASGFWDHLGERGRAHLVQRITGTRPSSVAPALDGWEICWQPLEADHVPQRLAFALIDEHHRHHGRPAGWKFGIALRRGRQLVGVAVVGRPVSRVLAARGFLEVTRCCTWGGNQARHAAGKLYALCADEARRRGCEVLCTYTLEHERGASLEAAGWRRVELTKGGTWDCPSRPRTDRAPTCRKWRWEIRLQRQLPGPPLRHLGTTARAELTPRPNRADITCVSGAYRL